MIAMEVVMAFFLEAPGFLGLLVYGDGRIGKKSCPSVTMQAENSHPLLRSTDTATAMRSAHPQAPAGVG
jgi:hypothetical protein